MGQSQPFEARFGGKCGACGDGIRVGTSVRYSEDTLVHADCEDVVDVDAPRRQERYCPDCFTLHAGECA